MGLSVAFVGVPPPAQAGKVPRSKKAYPQVLMAMDRHRIHSTFITIPAFT